MADQYSIKMPQPDVPIVEPTGGFARQFFYYCLALMERTGGQGPGIPAVTLQEAIAALAAAQAMEDVTFPPVPLAVSALFAEMMAETTPAQPQSPLVTLFFMDDPVAAPINPFLASMLVMDIA